MATTDLTGVSNKHRSIQEIMNTPGLAARLSSFADEAVACKQKISFEQENLKALRENASEELGIKPALFNQYVDMIYKNDFVQRKDKYEELVNMVNTVMESANMSLSHDED